MSSQSSWRRQSLSLTDSFAHLGFEPARTQTYDWMASIPDTNLLLEALKGFTDKNVLSSEEAAKYQEIINHQSTLSSSELLYVASPLLKSQSDLTLEQARKKQLYASRARLESLQAEKELLLEQLEAQSDDEETEDGVKSQESDFLEGACASLFSKTGELQDFSKDRLDSANMHAEFEGYLERERHFSSEVAERSGPGLENYSSAGSSKIESDPRVSKSIKSFAKLHAKKHICEAFMVRDTAWINALSEDDGKYMEMTASTMTTLISELKANNTKLLKSKASLIEEEARQRLLSQLDIISLSDKERQQKAYMEIMQTSISAFAQQRLRLVCVESVLESMVSVRDRLESCFEKLCCTEDPPGPVVYPNEQVNPDQAESSCSEIVSLDSSQASSSCIETAEVSKFLLVAQELLNQLQTLCATHSSSSETFLLGTQPRLAGVIVQLKAQLQKNTLVLNALMKKKASLLASSSEQARLTNQSWPREVLQSRAGLT